MGSCEDDWPITPKAQSDLGFHPSSSHFTPFIDQSSVEGCQTLTEVINGEEYGVDDDDDDNARIEYPLRPYSEDCSFYIRTGECKFGSTCRFNHPVRRENQGVNEKEKEKEKVRESDGFRDQTGRIECKYYLTAGGCKYGEDCRYNHSKEPIEREPVELNFLGLPVRMGERECPYYMRNGSCGYGANCRFHHPDPTDIVCSDPYNSTSIGEPGEVIPSWEQHNGPPDISKNFGVSQPALSSWSSDTISNPTASCSDNCSYSLPGLPKEAAVNLQERFNHANSVPVNNLVKNADVSNYPQQQIDVEEFPERPGQPECNYFMKTGYCKFRSACRYHHPRSQFSKLPVYEKGMKPACPQEMTRQVNLAVGVDSSINNADVSFYHQQQIHLEEFPERPGRPDCDYFMKTGSCKYRSACRYHHPKREALILGVYTLSDKDLPANPVYSQGKAEKMIAFSLNHLLKNEDVPTNHQEQIQVEEFPERPGHPECGHFMKTGYCKYGYSCRYHHPKNRASTLPVCTLNENGLPIRPDTKVCWHYEHYGICKYGSSCLFNHPEKYGSEASLGDSVSEPLPSSYSAPAGETKMDRCQDGSEALLSHSVGILRI